MNTLKRVMVSASMGLGLGIGLVLSIVPSQTVVQASPERSARYAVKPEQIIFERLEITQAIGADEAITQTNEVGLGDENTVRLVASSHLFGVLNELYLGDEVVLYGTNNGIYRYTVTQVNEVERGRSEQLGSDQQAQVVLNAHQFPWSTTELVVTLSYRQ
ncbi:MAG: hypothetical protein H6773_01925 [Pseudomonadales bacterium]|nr:hypothetical protein [Pseudomonadales bacterium]